MFHVSWKLGLVSPVETQTLEGGYINLINVIRGYKNLPSQEHILDIARLYMEHMYMVLHP